MTTQTMNFTCDPLFLVRQVLQMHVEKKIEGNFYKAKQFACYSFLGSLTDNTLEEILMDYVKKEKLEAITLSDWEKEAKLIFEIIEGRQDYKDLETKYKRSGYGETGLGVYDRQANRFYDCDPVHHFDTIKKIVEEEYSEKYEALQAMYVNSHFEEYDGYTREEIESFVMNNFELIGGEKKADFYFG